MRRCIQRFHLQNDGDMSFAKKHQQDGEEDDSRPRVNSLNVLISTLKPSPYCFLLVAEFFSFLILDFLGLFEGLVLYNL